MIHLLSYLGLPNVIQIALCVVLSFESASEDFGFIVWATLYPWIGLIKFAKTNTDAGQQFPYVWLKHSIFVNSYYFLLYFVIYTRNKESKIVWAFEEFQLYLASSG